MKTLKSISNRLIVKLGLSFLVIILFMSLVYMLLTFFLVERFYSQTTQRLNINVANHLIEEKFRDASPFLENGEVNKALFDDIMHDMMSVNRAIEVYLLNETGEILYSVVLDHSNPYKPLKKVSLVPVKQFLANRNRYVLGEDPREANKRKIFSAAAFEKNNRKGYIYIILASQQFHEVCATLFKDYFVALSLRSTLITMVFAVLCGSLLVWFLTKSLRVVIYHVNEFRQGHWCSRIPAAAQSDLSVLALTFNDMAQTIANHIQEKEALMRFRKELIANVAHDLRTPLTAIRGYVETLTMREERMEAADRREFMAVIEKSALHLTNLVNHLFEYATLDAKKLHLNPEPFYINDLLYDLKERYTLLAKERNIQIAVEIPPVMSPVMADVKLMERVLQNIIENALKFSKDGGTVFLRVLTGQTATKIQIEDAGPGISEQESQRIFKRLEQGAARGEEKGIGLGLAIVKKIIELHGSEVKLKSRLGVGTVFEFDLPNYQNAN